jgi:hypothetical protein
MVLAFDFDFDLSIIYVLAVIAELSKWLLPIRYIIVSTILQYGRYFAVLFLSSCGFVYLYL